MATTNINTVTLTGNLTRDPELRSLPTGTSVCELGIAVNESVKNPQTGEWEERANFFDVTVWGRQGETCARFLSKGRPVAISGRLRWESWEQDGQKRSKVKVVANAVQFLGGRDDAMGGGGGGGGATFTPQTSDVPTHGGDFQPAPAGAPAANGGGFGGGGAADDDIPF